MGRQNKNPDDHNIRDKPTNYKDAELDWKNYTSIENIRPNDQIHLFIELQNHEEKNMPIIRDMIKKTHFDFTFIQNEFDEYVLTILSNGKVMAVVMALENCIVVRFENLHSMKSLKKLFLDKFTAQSVSVGTIHNIEEKFTVGNTEVEARIKTGNILDSPYLAPESFWKFYLNNECIGRALIKFYASEICECAPTAIMFEISKNFRRKYLGTNLFLSIEDYMFDHGFKKMRLEDMKAINFWKQLGYSIDIDEGEKELGHLDDNYD